MKEAIQKRERLGKRLGGDKGVMGRGPGRPLSGRSDLGRDGEFRPKKQKMDRPNRMNKMDRDTVEPQKNRVNGEAKKGFPRGGLKRAGPQGR